MARFIFLSVALFGRAAAVQLRVNNSADVAVSWNPDSIKSNIRPIMMFAHGCSMTTAGINMAKTLLQEHGITVADTGCGEMVKSLERYTDKQSLKDRMGAFGQEEELVDKVLRSETLLEKFQIVYDWSQRHGTTLLWKMELPTIEPHEGLGEFLQQVGTRAFLYLRTNLIDVLHCRVHDFCDKKENIELGIPVTKGGDQASCGFRGRDSAISGESTTSVEEKLVKLYPNSILSKLKSAAGGDELHTQYLKQHGYNSQLNSAEELFAFEYAAGKDTPEFTRSLQAWKQLVESLGIRPNEAAIERALLEYGTFTPPQKHAEKFYNYDEIKNILEGTPYYGMLRQ